MYQVVEKGGYSVDWAAVRYDSKALTRFEKQEDALKVAKEYVTDVNCNNALAKDEKLGAAEVFMMVNDEVFLGVLDGKDWYLTYPKDMNVKGIITHHKGDRVKDRKFFTLEGKTEVAVRKLPGT